MGLGATLTKVGQDREVVRRIHQDLGFPGRERIGTVRERGEPGLRRMRLGHVLWGNAGEPARQEAGQPAVAAGGRHSCHLPGIKPSLCSPLALGLGAELESGCKYTLSLTHSQHTP